MDATPEAALTRKELADSPSLPCLVLGLGMLLPPGLTPPAGAFETFDAEGSTPSRFSTKES